MNNRFVNKVINYLRKKSPEILLGVGITGVVTGTVLACKATIDVQPELEVSVEEINKVKNDIKEEKDEEVVSALKGSLKDNYIHTAKTIAKAYLPSATVMGGSIACILGSHGILNKRYMALGAAYTTLDGCFKSYRENIIDKYGVEADTEARFDVKANKVKAKKGEEPKKEYKVTDKTLSAHSDYAKFFDASSKYWEKNPEYNLMFLKRQEAYWNDYLKIHGRVFLNQVYESLGIKATQAGQIVGWVYDEKCPLGDNYISFGLYDINSEAGRSFINGNEPVILLDFNVDGNVWESM